MSERQQFQEALDFLHGMWLPNKPEHKDATQALSDLFETLNADAYQEELALDEEHKRWLYEWARGQWESVPARGAAPPLEL